MIYEVRIKLLIVQTLYSAEEPVMIEYVEAESIFKAYNKARAIVEKFRNVVRQENKGNFAYLHAVVAKSEL